MPGDQQITGYGNAEKDHTFYQDGDAVGIVGVFPGDDLHQQRGTEGSEEIEAYEQEQDDGFTEIEFDDLFHEERKMTGDIGSELLDCQEPADIYNSCNKAEYGC